MKIFNGIDKMIEAPCDECVHWMSKCELDGDFRRWCFQNKFIGFRKEGSE